MGLRKTPDDTDDALSNKYPPMSSALELLTHAETADWEMNCGQQCVKLACKKKRKHSDNAASSLIKVKADHFTRHVTLVLLSVAVLF